VNKTCHSFGVIATPPNIELFDPADVRASLQLVFESIFPNLTCDPFDPVGYLFFHPNATVGANFVGLSGTSASVGRISSAMPTPHQAGGERSFVNLTKSGEFVSLDLAQYDINQSGGQANVRVTGDQTRDAVLCSARSDCDGEGYATVRLFTGRNCFGYRLYERPVWIARVDWMCDRPLSAGEFGLPSNMNVRGGALTFQVRARDV
jgi:hypothetical protein